MKADPKTVEAALAARLGAACDAIRIDRAATGGPGDILLDAGLGFRQLIVIPAEMDRAVPPPGLVDLLERAVRNGRDAREAVLRRIAEIMAHAFPESGSASAECLHIPLGEARGAWSDPHIDWSEPRIDMEHHGLDHALRPQIVRQEHVWPGDSLSEYTARQRSRAAMVAAAGGRKDALRCCAVLAAALATGFVHRNARFPHIGSESLLRHAAGRDGGTRQRCVSVIEGVLNADQRLDAAFSHRMGRIRLSRTLPVTLGAALVGRPISALISHPLLVDMKILAVGRDPLMTWLVVESPTVPLAPIMAAYRVD